MSTLPSPFITNPSLVRFGVRDIAPAAPTYVTVDDRLLVTTMSATAGTLFVTWRVLMPTGEIALDRESFVTNGTRVPEFRRFTLQEGFLLSVDVSDIGENFTHGDMYVMLEIIRNDNINPTGTPQIGSSMLLTSGYCFWERSLGWPGGPTESPQDQIGRTRAISVANPAAGAEFSRGVDSNTLWELVAVRFQLVTSITVATRIPHLVLDDGANVFANVPSPSGQAASLTQRYSAGGGLPSVAVNDQEVLLPVPQMIRLRSGWRIRSLTTALQAADQYSAIAFNVKEWLLF